MQGIDPRTGPFALGHRFLKYEIQNVLGRGGHAFVYDGYDPFLDRHVAIKIITKPADTGRDLSKRAQLEARVLCRLQHPNVVHVIDAGATDEGFVYIIMDLLEGRTLREAIVDFGRLTIPETLLVGAQIADGVQAAHDQQAVHRDLKPENVFLQPNNIVKVLDFGIAKFLGQAAITTRKDLLQGTLLYMSPEHLQGFGVTPRSDIFALGTMLYEALAGRPPCLLGVQEPVMNVIAWAQVNTMPPPLDELTGTVPRYVARSIHRMIAKQPDDRFASMAEVAQVLRGNLSRFANEAGDACAPPRDIWKKAPTNLPKGWLGSQDGSETERVDPSFVGRTPEIREPRPTDTERLDEGASWEPPTGLRDHPAFKDHRRSPVASQDTPPALATGVPVASRPSGAHKRSVLVPIIGAAVATGAIVGTTVGVMRYSARSAANQSAAATDTATLSATTAAQTPVHAPAQTPVRAPAPPPASPTSSPVVANTATTASTAIASTARAAPALTTPHVAHAATTAAAPQMATNVAQKPKAASTTPVASKNLDVSSVKSGLDPVEELPSSGLDDPSPRRSSSSAK